MLYLEPSLRRKYLNLILSQTDKFYLEALGNYTKILKQRNALLEEIAEEKSREDELDTWDEKLAEEGAVLILERKKLIKFFNGKIGGFYRKISGGKENLEIKYSSTTSDSHAEGEPAAPPADRHESVIHGHDSPADDLHSIKKQYLKKLILKRDRDLRYGTTGTGPHLEDIKFYLNGKEISTFASRGEFRTILIALKMAEIEYTENKTKEKPVLLLDDVFSELDENRQSHLFDAIKSCQAIITAAGIASNHLEDKISKVVEL
jgi:DNA replication and repair protein RecF